jgi:hypothetical protein
MGVRELLTASLTALAPWVVLIALLHLGVWPFLLLLLVVACAVLDAPLLRGLADGGSWFISLKNLPALLLYRALLPYARILGALRREIKQDPWWLVAALLALVTILGIQYFKDTWRGEFNEADEAGHLVTGLMVRDYTLHWPLPEPISWAKSYYLYYPQVGLGHWPPLFYVVQAFWFLLLPPSRETAMLLMTALGWLCAIAFYCLLRRVIPGRLAVAGMLAMLITPTMISLFADFLADVISLLLGLMFVRECVRYVESRSLNAARNCLILVALALLNKGTGVVLFPAAVLALLISGRWRDVPVRAWAILAAGGLAAAVMVVGLQMQVEGNLQRIAGLVFTTDSLSNGYRLAGLGFAALAVVGAILAFRLRDSLLQTAVAVSVAMTGTTLLVGAINTTRHWIFALPTFLILAFAAIRTIRATALRLVLVVVCTSLAFRHSRPEPMDHPGVTAVMAELSRKGPAPRTLVSSTRNVEGSWVAMAALVDLRDGNKPRSMVLRASKVLADCDWNGRCKNVIVQTSEQVDQLLDAWRVDRVALHTDPAGKDYIYHRLLVETMPVLGSWNQCAEGKHIRVFCRVVPPRFPAQPVKMDLHQLGIVSEAELDPSWPPRP